MVNKTNSALLDKLLQIQKAKDIPDVRFSKLLRISQPMWTQIKAGNRKIGIAALVGIVTNFPELKNDVLAFLLEGNNERQAKRRPGNPSQVRS